MGEVVGFPASSKAGYGRKPLSKKIRFEVLKRDSFKCQYCGNSAPDVLLEVDHIKPVAQGGTNDIWNLVTSCQPCNSGKSDRTLSDQTVVAKAKKQLDQLQERREQLEMLMEWQAGLAGLEQEALDSISDFCNQQMKGYCISAKYREDLGRLVHRYGAESVVEAIAKSAKQYLKTNGDDKGHTQESVDEFIYGIGAMCEVGKRTQANPNAREIFYIRGIVRKRLHGKYFLSKEAYNIIDMADSWGVPNQEMRRLTVSARSWSSWRSAMYDIIDEYRAKDEARHA